MSMRMSSTHGEHDERVKHHRREIQIYVRTHTRLFVTEKPKGLRTIRGRVSHLLHRGVHMRVSDEVFHLLKGPTSWADVAKLPCICSNFGGEN